MGLANIQARQLFYVDKDTFSIWFKEIYDRSGQYRKAIKGQTPFGMMRSQVGKFIVASSFMRLFYELLKALAFGFMTRIKFNTSQNNS